MLFPHAAFPLLLHPLFSESHLPSFNILPCQLPYSHQKGSWPTPGACLYTLHATCDMYMCLCTHSLSVTLTTQGIALLSTDWAPHLQECLLVVNRVQLHFCDSVGAPWVSTARMRWKHLFSTKQKKKITNSNNIEAQPPIRKKPPQTKKAHPHMHKTPPNSQNKTTYQKPTNLLVSDRKYHSPKTLSLVIRHKRWK